MESEQCEQLKKQIKNRVIELNIFLSSDDVIDSTDDSHMENISEAEVSHQIIDNAKQELKALNKSLFRLNSDDAGICEHCGAEIAFARLQALPVAVLCINCA